MDRLTARFPARVSDPINFVNRTRVLPVATVAGVRLDYIFAAFPFERTMLSRAVVRELGTVSARVATREDLILLKIPSGRAKDRNDVRLLLHEYARDLDWPYLLAAVDLISATLEQPELSALLRQSRPAQS